MKASEFFQRVKEEGVEVSFQSNWDIQPGRLSNEAMFHLPLISIAILMMAKGRAKPAVDEIGQLVGDCYERSFPGFRGSAQHLGWSASLRVRTVQALSFLEQARLVQIDPQSKRIESTELGAAVIDRAFAWEGDLAFSLSAVEKSYRNIRAERQLKLVMP